MDKRRHPQVIRPWKTQQTQKRKWSAPALGEPRRDRSKKPTNLERSRPSAQFRKSILKYGQERLVKES